MRFEQAVEQDPTDWKSVYYLGLIRLQQGRWFTSRMLLERALVLRRDHPETADILDALAESMSRLKQIDDLHALLDQAIEDYGTSRDYMRQGRYLMELGDVDAAKLSYRKGAYFAADGDAGPFVALADFYESIGDTSGAIEALRYAFAITPKNRALQDRLRRYGIVPGPTVGLVPEKISP